MFYDRLIFYGQHKLKKLKKEAPQEYKFAKYCTDNAFYIAALSKEKVAANPTKYGEVTISDISKINFHELKIDLKQKDFQAFVIKGTNSLLIVRSKDYILQELKKKYP